MTLPETISADYTLRPSELAEVLALLVEARQPTMVWGPPGSAKSMIARQVAAAASRWYVDVRALLLDIVDLRGIPWRDQDGRTRWAPPVFLPPSDDPGLWLINLEELPSAVPMVQAALYQLMLERKMRRVRAARGRIADCLRQPGERPGRRAPHADAAQQPSRPSGDPGRRKGLVRLGGRERHRPEVLFFIEYEPELLHQFDPQSKEHAFPEPPELGVRASNILKHRNGLDPGDRAGALPGHRGRGRGGGVHGVPQGLPRAAPPEGRPQRPRERRHPGQRERADGALRLALPDGDATSRMDAIVTYATSGSGGRWASRSSARACAASRPFSVRPASSAGPRPRPSEGERHDTGGSRTTRRAMPRRADTPCGRRSFDGGGGGSSPPFSTFPCGRSANPRGGTSWTSTATPCWSACTSPPGPAGSTTARRATTSPSTTRLAPAPGATTSACCPRPPSPHSPPP